MTLLKINKHIQEIKSKLLMKDTKIDLLNTEVKTAYTIIHSLQQRINELELQKKIQDEQMEVTEHANMDLLRSWVNEQLKTIPSECEIYCGLYDILEGKTPENILDCVGYLISDFKEKNNKMKINVCQIVPVPLSLEIQCNISDYNEQSLKWGEANGVGIVKTTPEFTLGTGSVDELCFEDEENKPILLNRLE